MHPCTELWLIILLIYFEFQCQFSSSNRIIHRSLNILIELIRAHTPVRGWQDKTTASPESYLSPLSPPSKNKEEWGTISLSADSRQWSDWRIWPKDRSYRPNPASCTLSAYHRERTIPKNWHNCSACATRRNTTPRSMHTPWICQWFSYHPTSTSALYICARIL